MGNLLTYLDKDYGQTERRVARAVLILFVLGKLQTVYGLGFGGVKKALVNTLLKGGKFIPGVEGAISAELDKEMESIRRSILGDGDPDAVLTIPAKGYTDEAILSRAENLIGEMEGFTKGKKWGGIYYRNTALSSIQGEMWKRFSCTNLLYPGVFPCARKLEAELVSMACDMVHGNVGVLTSGGTESILVAMLAYREAAKQRGITEPEIVAGKTAHPAVVKAAFYFKMKLVSVPVDPETVRMTAALTAPYVNKNTVCIFASAPTFSHGVVDPIEELAELAVARNVGLHVDNCLGGFLLSYLQKEGLFNKQWDFRVKGVTSMSVDVHKYGFASKGVSTTIFRDNSLRQASYCASSDGCEGLYITPTLQGSRSGAVVAAAWATVVKMGDEGYRQAARRLDEAKEAYIKVIESHPELRLLTRPDAAMVPICSNSPSLNIYLLASLLEKKGWNMFTGQHPAVMSVCVGEQHTPQIIDAWAADVSECIETIKANPDMKVEGTAAVYGSASTTPDELLHSVMKAYVDTTLTAKKRE
eukprot:TRINITY_DN4701_c0_g1_i1.p1 TRINITY_DN4701_c0_g1~~TRINITY_DN4701_c0_g1_i1.p1  ORF type:complete len:530 (+),score=207.77 TRINITY_DN4701_c0_g1_i1:1092-2681(+)